MRGRSPLAAGCRLPRAEAVRTKVSPPSRRPTRRSTRRSSAPRRGSTARPSTAFASNLGESDLGARLVDRADAALDDAGVPIHLRGGHRAVARRQGRRVRPARLRPARGLRLPRLRRPRGDRRRGRRRRFVDKVRDGGPRHRRGCAPTTASTTSAARGGALGVVDGALVLGSEAAFKVAVDAQDGESLTRERRVLRAASMSSATSALAHGLRRRSAGVSTQRSRRARSARSEADAASRCSAGGLEEPVVAGSSRRRATSLARRARAPARTRTPSPPTRLLGALPGGGLARASAVPDLGELLSAL